MTGYQLYGRARARVALFVGLFVMLSVLMPIAPLSAAAVSDRTPVERGLNPRAALNLQAGGSGRGQSAAGSPNVPQSLSWFRLLHKPMTGSVNAIAFIGNDLYIGGNFTFTADDNVTTVHNIAKYSGGVWSALAHTGIDNTVDALAVMGTDLYVGGSFSGTADGAVTNMIDIAKYDTIGQSWTILSSAGLGGTVWSLAVIGSDVYAGGDFISTAAAPFVSNLNFIAEYSGGTWAALAHHGLNGSVRALTVSGSDLYVGGQFDFTNDTAVTNLTDIARYSGGAWSALANQGLNGAVLALTMKGSDLYAGGAFTQTHNSLVSNLNHIARYDTGGGAWSALAHSGLNGNVVALIANGNEVYAGGYFAKTFDNAVTNLNSIARYDAIGGAWSALPNQGLSNPVLALTSSGTDVYVGGSFGGTFDATYTGQIVKLGSGFSVYLPLILQ